MNRLFLITGLLAVLLAGCSRHKPETAMPPLRVGVAEAVTDSVPNRMEFIGYLASNFDAVIQPRVNGYLLTKQFANGMPVKRGQLLFTIDPDQLSTSMLAAEAALQSARAQAIEARNNYDRAVPLARIDLYPDLAELRPVLPVDRGQQGPLPVQLLEQAQGDGLWHRHVELGIGVVQPSQ